MKFLTPDARFGASLESLLARRERSADAEGVQFGANRMFEQLAKRVLYDVRPDMRVLEVDPGAGLFTRLFLARGAEVTALEPSSVFVRQLQSLNNDRLTVIEGFTEDLPEDAEFDVAVVTFAARRGIGLLALLNELVEIVKGKILVVLPDDGSLDWAYLMRGAALEGFDTVTRFITDGTLDDPDHTRKAVLISLDAPSHIGAVDAHDVWELSARTIRVPYPVPRGAATRLVRYFVTGGDRAVLITTEKQGLTRLYGNLRTAAHRIARDEVTVRRVDEGIQLMQIPRSGE